MSEVQNGTVSSGSGVVNATGDTYMVHCPRPRTERGKRRHEKRSDAQKAHANSVYEKPSPKTFHSPQSCNHQSCKSVKNK